jgi:molybdate transport system substrate-binding protein
MSRRWPAALGVLLLALAGVAPAAEPTAEPGVAPKPITVFAAASLKESVDTIGAEWERRSGQKVLVSYAASNLLARQIEKGAPAQVFISADEDWMDYLAQRKLIDASSRFEMVGNRLVLVAPRSTRTMRVDLRKPAQFTAALAGGRLAVADTETVPAGKYARQALTRLGLWETASKQLAPAENVRAALAFVARGEAPLGVVYATDALVESRVRVVARFPPDSHARIAYPAARVASARVAETAGFLEFLRSRRARAIFVRAGFTAP